MADPVAAHQGESDQPPVGALERSLGCRRDLICEVCAAQATSAGSARSTLGGAVFDLARCPSCGFAFVVRPRTDFETLYDERYYRGQGADPSVDYERELAGQPTVRSTEWEGIVATVARLQPGDREPWLDFGCGYGSFVQYLRSCRVDAVGYDSGHAASVAATAAVPVLDDAALDASADRFAVVTAIEVLEHVLDPVTVLARIASVMAPEGLLFVTTGNAARHRSLGRWRYVAPDIHVSYYEPRTLELLYRTVGLVPVSVGYGAGSTGILRYRVLKALGQSRPTRWQRLVPWGLAGRLADAKEGLTAQPAARRPRRPAGAAPAPSGAPG